MANPGWWRVGPAARLTAAAVVSAVLAGVAYVIFVRTGLGQRVDNAALAGSLHQLPQTRMEDASLLRRISADSFALVLVVIAVIGLLRRRPRLGIGVAVAAGVAVIVTDLLKSDILTRPFLSTTDGLLPVNSFPSGHTATAIACALALVVVTPPRWRGLAAVVAGTYAWLIAAWVQTAGWHRLSDAIGAAFIAFSAVALIAALVAVWRPVGTVSSARQWPAQLVLGLIWLGAVGYFGWYAAKVLHFLSVHSDATALTPAVQNDAYQISLSLTVAIVVSLLMALLALLGRCDLDQPRPLRIRRGAPAPLIASRGSGGD
ncbi:MAG TPA: phosphatase PAP2 family protein [Mycobacteriales bacterium]|nr:phosphatase PAP2 family protein [Mycobacteriales bacterium]